MLQIFQSNDLKALTDAFCERLQAPGSDPFAPAVVLTQSYGTGQWLKLEIATRLGIAANISCQLPAHFIWQLYASVLSLPKESPFRVDALTFRLMPLLRQLGAPAVDHYLAGPGDADLRCFQLASEVAGQFDRYLVYRPDWILDWEQGGAKPDGRADWQAELWRHLVRDPELRGQHRAAMHSALMGALSRADSTAQLPDRLSVFGLSSLPPAHTQVLQAVARHIPVDLYFMNPCLHYWGDIVAERDLSKRSVRALIGKSEPLVDDDYLEVGNPLLASLGKQGREFLELLLGQDEAETFDLFIEDLPGPHLLGRLQQDILQLQFGGVAGAFVTPEPVPIAAGDRSIEFHVCHSRQRELEVLRDQLLDIFAHTDTRAEDVIVMAPDISPYAPFIHALFQGEINYGIADQSLARQSALLGSVLDLLALPEARITSVEIMDLLEVPAIARRFALDEGELQTLAGWIRDMAIRWELDGESKASHWQVPAESQNTWRFGLDRALLGIMLDSDNGRYGDIYPFDMTAGDTELLDKLLRFIDLVAHYREQLAMAHSPVAWSELLSRLVKDLIDPRDQEVIEIEQFLALGPRLVALAGNPAQGLSSQLVRYWLKHELSAATTAVSFISGGVTFATLVPMRSIPFKVVCLLGMNDADFPRRDPSGAFDLMQDDYRPGDRSRRADDRYLFLEALLSARERLLVTYQGRTSRDNKERPPSVVVSELQDVIRRLTGEVPVTDHPLQPFSTRYFQSDGPITYRADWFEARANPLPVVPFADTRLAPDETAVISELAELERFFRHPARHYLNQRLGVTFDEDDIDLKDTEAFSLDNLERFQLGDDALAHLVRGEDINAWRKDVVAQGIVTAGPLGSAQLDRATEQASAIHADLAAYLPACEALTLNTVIGEDTLFGHLPLVATDYQLYYRYGRLSARHRLQAWLSHLLLCAADQPRQMILLTFDKKKVQTNTFAPLDADDASRYLAELIGLYHQGAEQPLCLPPETSLAFFDEWQKNQDLAAATTKAMATWQPDQDAGFAEGQDRYNQRLFTLPDDLDEAFVDRVVAVFAPIATAMAGAP